MYREIDERLLLAKGIRVDEYEIDGTEYEGWGSKCHINFAQNNAKNI